MSSQKKSSSRLKLILQIFGAFTILLTLFPFIPVDHWTIRIFDFPHLQLTFLSLFALIVYFIKFNIRSVIDYLFVIALAACCLFQASKIYPYTVISPYEVLDSSPNSEDLLSIYTANVLQDNEDTISILKDVKQFNADLLLFTETNSKWIEVLTKSLNADYNYRIEVPKENTYGMLLLSKYEVYDQKVVYLVEDTIPSIQAKLRLPSGNRIQVLAIHPAPPTPQHNPSSVDRDAELMKTAKLARNSNLPVIVLGDFNDVAWSETTKLFQNASGLLDLRKGRGLFNTYNAKNWIMRWPLDHIFTSAHFRVKAVELGDKIGSDHFPFYTQLSLESELAAEQELPPPSPEVLKEAFEQIENEEDSKE